MKPSIILPIASILFFACEKQNPYGELIPGTFNTTTVIIDNDGNSTDLAGDWDVFTDPEESYFTHYLHFDQEMELSYNILDNDIFRISCEQGKESLPLYSDGVVDKRRSMFPWNNKTPLIYLNGKGLCTLTAALIHPSGTGG